MLYPILFLLGVFLHLGLAMAFAVNGFIGFAFVAIFLAIVALSGMVVSMYQDEI